MTAQQWAIRWGQKSYTTAQPCELGVQRKVSWHREVLRLFSLCYQAEGHQEHLYSCVSCKHFQEEMPPDTVLNKGVQGWWCKRGS